MFFKAKNVRKLDYGIQIEDKSRREYDYTH